MLILDECTPSFRGYSGGLHFKNGMEHDIEMIGKQLFNGCAFTATMRRYAVMKEAQIRFNSSTLWTGRIGSSTNLKTFEMMERERNWEQDAATGLELRRRW